MTKREKAELNAIINHMMWAYSIGIPIMLILGSIFFELVVKAV